MANFTEEEIQAIWDRARVAETDPNKGKYYRLDPVDAWMKRDEHGNKEHKMGWEVDHALPESKGGEKHPGNLRAMQWENNNRKDNDFPRYTAAVTALGDTNIDKEQPAVIGEGTLKKLKKIYPNNPHIKKLKL